VRELTQGVKMNLLSVLIQEAEFVPDPSRVTAGWLGGIFFFGFFGIVIFGWRNMTKRLKRIDANFEKSPSKQSKDLPPA
jgi:hypothetical protein